MTEQKFKKQRDEKLAKISDLEKEYSRRSTRERYLEILDDQIRRLEKRLAAV